MGFSCISEYSCIFFGGLVNSVTNVSWLSDIYQRRELHSVNTQRRNFSHEKRKKFIRWKGPQGNICRFHLDLPSWGRSTRVTLLVEFAAPEQCSYGSFANKAIGDPHCLLIQLKVVKNLSFETPSEVLPLISYRALAKLPTFSKLPFLYL